MNSRPHNLIQDVGKGFSFIVDLDGDGLVFPSIIVDSNPRTRLYWLL